VYVYGKLWTQLLQEDAAACFVLLIYFHTINVLQCPSQKKKSASMSRLEDKIRQHGKSEGYSHAHWYRLKLKANKQQWPCMQIGGIVMLLCMHQNT